MKQQKIWVNVFNVFESDFQIFRRRKGIVVF